MEALVRQRERVRVRALLLVRVRDLNRERVAVRIARVAPVRVVGALLDDRLDGDRRARRRHQRGREVHACSSGRSPRRRGWHRRGESGAALRARVRRVGEDEPRSRRRRVRAENGAAAEVREADRDRRMGERRAATVSQRPLHPRVAGAGGRVLRGRDIGEGGHRQAHQPSGRITLLPARDHARGRERAAEHRHSRRKPECRQAKPHTPLHVEPTPLIPRNASRIARKHIDECSASGN